MRVDHRDHDAVGHADAQGLAQPRDQPRQRPRQRWQLMPPDRLLDALGGQHTADVREQHHGQVEFLRRHRDALAVQGGEATHAVELVGAGLHHQALAHALAGHAPAQCRDARQQHARIERTANVVVGACVERIDQLVFAVVGGQQDDRHIARARAAHRAHHLERRQVGQGIVDQQHVVQLLADAVDQLAAGLEHAATEAGALQQFGHGTELGRKAHEQRNIHRRRTTGQDTNRRREPAKHARAAVGQPWPRHPDGTALPSQKAY
ncbi:hypothetical protein CBM2589_A70372 [Cupriavidus taiwanensis]|uniref:Uncharacterized protein n=1 Tax=Cupriavidus taiwanensis TaxID=164546 RepID=A0A375C7L1_9BURK|nr:hypothetical protein CBM2589_A70372 [Cupriavidus taiwanensis]